MTMLMRLWVGRGLNFSVLPGKSRNENILPGGSFFGCLLCSCSGTDYTYVDTNEEKPGPGLFSGDDGVFNVIKKDSEEVDKEKEATEKTSSE